MTAALQLASFACAVIAWLCVMLPHLAPEGWQDADGFHYGEPGDLGSFHGEGV
ncbi:MAG: hypothetical protein ACK4Z8_04795 [Novosphingobium sp.]